MSELMWTEKYRPRSLVDMVNQEHVVSRLRSMLKFKDIPHLLFAGPPGTGKTAAILAFARDLYGEEKYRESCLELNASDSRGIDVIRTDVKNFARTLSLGDVPFKILILDEADSMTSDAQHALRRTMERFARTCRFCLICNYSGRIIQPIQSRCALFRFTPLSRDDMAGRLLYIAEKEGLEVEDGGIEAILEIAGGDMRGAINTLQTAVAIGGKITYDSVYSVVGRVKPTEASDMVGLALNGRFIESRKKLRVLLIDEGFSGTDILRQIHRFVLRSKLDEKWKVKLMEKIGEADYRIVSGTDEEIQLSALLAEFDLVGSEMGKERSR
ncbi:MAG: replication factor C small subunit [Candidatus Bathyarchaeota archaeon]|nr:replication factor C small subunit [Candidatus Bathyarchaeota archaeon]